MKITIFKIPAILLLSVLMFVAASCSKDNNDVLKRMELAVVREIKGANNLFVLDLQNAGNSLHSRYVVPGATLPAEYKEDGLFVFISGDVTNNSIAVDGYITESEDNTISLSGRYNTFEIKTISKNVTGTVIGSYSNGFASLLVQIEKTYPIGKTIEYVHQSCNLFLPQYGTYRNMIQVQVNNLPLSDLFEKEPINGKRISFSCRAYRCGEEDAALFNSGKPGNALCMPLDVPIYIITNGQILN